MKLCFVVLQLLFVLIATGARAFAEDVVSCECEQLSCQPCEIEQGVSFYSTKCGPGGARVKSCKKPTCQAAEKQNECLALLHQSQLHPGTQTNAEPIRAPASMSGTRGIEAGAVTKTQGAASITHGDGVKENAREGLKVFAGDRVETEADGRVRIKLVDLSELTVASKTQVRLTRVELAAKGIGRKIVLNLFQGRVRNRVEKKNDPESFYVVRTETAIAGVRGTDFVTSFDKNQKEWVTGVQTIEGLVHLENVAGPNEDPANPNEVKSADIAGGAFASFTVERSREKDAEADFFSDLEKGYLSPVIKLKDDDLKKIEAATNFEIVARADVAKRAPASVDTTCSAPAGDYNQCSFTCENNGKKEKTCRLDKAGVTCVRRICRANGVWAEPTRLPASEGDRCATPNVSVHDCGGYW